MFTVEHLDSIQARNLLSDLIALLRDSVDNGASVGFLPPLDQHIASDYWADVFRAIEKQSRILLVARHGSTIVGTAQLDLCTRQNGSHRAEVMKLLVHTAWRRQGIGEMLMQAIEQQARHAHRTTLVLDTRAGDPSEKLYRKLGYTCAGIIPQYVHNESGALEATAIFYRLL
ncbi:MAG: GNAT family N-acetyltransferase [Chloroflexi bacterium]|nr:GNAT family N-acetyltransferase [Chloroflexota bacterium]